MILELIHVSIPVQNQILAALLAWIITGVGGGMVLLSSGSAGGSDILSVIILKKYSIGIGNSMLIRTWPNLIHTS
ncbi:MAG: YitT family protein [Thermodesulfobacteriota bacterium]|nr:YitT family protein [Thermodesulfobacteriota bacterium]